MILILVQIFLAVNLLTAQSTIPSISWQNSIGGSGDEVANSIKLTPDGGFIVAGTSSSNDGNITGNHGQDDACLVKLNATGNLEWQHCYGGTGVDKANSIVLTPDGGYVAAGKSSSHDGDVTGNHGGSDFWVFKTNSQGIIQWQKSYGGTQDEEANAIQLTSDGGFIVAGISASNDGDVSGNHGMDDAWIIKVDQNGTLQWQKIFGGSLDDIVNDIDNTSDGGYIVTGFSRSNDGDIPDARGQEDFWYFKLSANGNLLWDRTAGGTGGDCASAGIQTTDGGYVLCGLTHSKDLDIIDPHGDHDMWVVKTNSDGIPQWTNCLGGSAGDNGIDIKQQTDGTIIACGYTSSNDGDVSGLHGLQDIWLIALDASGNLLWQKTLGGSGGDYPRSLQIISTGQYIVAGTSNSNDGDVSENHGNDDFWILKLDAVSSSPSIVTLPGIFNCFPNPSNGQFTLNLKLNTTQTTAATIEIVNSLDQRMYVEQVFIANGELKKEIDATNFLNTGVYTVKVIAENHTFSSRLIIAE